VNGVGKLGWLLGFMFPPAANGWFPDFCEGILQTLGMAFFGTLFAALFALPFGFLGARNVVSSFLIHFSLRRSFDCLRGVDTLIWALVFVNVVGLGPFAGILAIVVSDTGSLAKLFAEAIENIDRKQVDGVRASGASELEVVRFGILPQVVPVILSQTLYYFESNTRSATILGIVGAGGIGLQLSDRIRVNNWDEACLIIIMILVTVSAIDYVSKLIRLRIIQAQEYRP
jgi:phosphonate transport system permease protein